MMTFNDFLNEAKLKDNSGIPDDFIQKSDDKALRDLRVRKDDDHQKGQLMAEIVPLIDRSKQLMFGGLSRHQQEERAQQLEDLAKRVIMNEYSDILANVDLDIKLVGLVSDEIPEIANQDVTPSPMKQREELKKKGDDEEEKKEEENTDKKQSFLDKLMGSKPKKQEEEDFLKSSEYKKGIDKAKLINNIIQGEAKNTKHILHSDMVKDGLREIFGRQSEEIFKVWDDLTKVADKLDWAWDIESKSQMMKTFQPGMAGAVKVEWPEAEEGDEDDEEGNDSCPSCDSAEDILKKIEEGGDLSDNKEEIGELLSTGNPKIIAVGIDFPMLLHETVKGIYELIAAAYLPNQDATTKERNKAKVIQMGVSSFEDEAEDFRYGPMIAAALRDFVNSCPGWDRYPNIREYVFGKMVLLTSDEFLSLMKGILNKTDKAKRTITEMIDEVISEIREWEIGEIDEPSYEEPEYQDEPEQPEEEDEISKLIRQTQEEPAAIDGEIDYTKLRRDDLEDELNAAMDSKDKKALDAISKELRRRDESVMLLVYGSDIERILKS